MARSGDGEQSMEDILASIRRIIADDMPPPGEPVAAAAGERADVLDLTDLVEPEPAAAPIAPVPASPVSAEVNAIEDMVRDLLRPMLRDWLDANLPAIVERQVSGEVERISGRTQ